MKNLFLMFHEIPRFALILKFLSIKVRNLFAGRLERAQDAKSRGTVNRRFWFARSALSLVVPKSLAARRSQIVDPRPSATTLVLLSAKSQPWLGCQERSKQGVDLSLFCWISWLRFFFSCRSCRMMDPDRLECHCAKEDGSSIVSSVRYALSRAALRRSRKIVVFK